MTTKVIKDKVLVENDNFGNIAEMVLSSMLKDSSTHDTTLISSDKKQITCHKAVLISNSEVFRSLFSFNNLSKPTIHLNDVKSNELIPLVVFMYTGKIVVTIRNMKNLIDSATKLRIFTLTQPYCP